MKYSKKYNESNNKSKYSDLALELDYKLRTLEDSKFTWDDFFEEFNVDNPTDFIIGAILKQREEKYVDLSDEDFFKLYKNR